MLLSCRNFWGRISGARPDHAKCIYRACCDDYDRCWHRCGLFAAQEVSGHVPVSHIRDANSRAWGPPSVGRAPSMMCKNPNSECKHPWWRPAKAFLAGAAVGLIITIVLYDLILDIPIRGGKPWGIVILCALVGRAVLGYHSTRRGSGKD